MVLEVVLGIAPVFVTYYLVAVGHGFFEKSGVLNLAVDGLFVLAATVAFAVSVYTGSPWLGLVVAGVADMLFGVFIAYIVTKLPLSHGALGLSLMFLGYGLSLLVGIPANNYAYAKALRPANYTIPITWVTESTLYVVSLLIGITLYYVLERTKLGAAIKAVGEDPHIAEALGVDITRTRIIAGLIGYMLIGVGGALFTLMWRMGWDPKIYLLGHGWIAFAISLSAGRHPILTMLIAGLFSGLVKYQYSIQTTLRLSTEIAKMLPFIAAIVAMTLFYITPLKKKLASSRSLGKPYYREERTV